MRSVELRVPPPVVGLLFAAGMWAVTYLPPIVELPRLIRLPVAAALAAIGIAIAFGGVVSFRRAKTTVNPLKPETSAALVSTIRMYLGMVLVLFAWAAYLSSIWSLIGPVLFALYITRFQIIPEEQVLDRLFGAPFAEYKKRVRRWL